jgi:hypothetical protein
LSDVCVFGLLLVFCCASSAAFVGSKSDAASGLVVRFAVGGFGKVACSGAGLDVLAGAGAGAGVGSSSGVGTDLEVFLLAL